MGMVINFYYVFFCIVEIVSQWVRDDMSSRSNCKTIGTYSDLEKNEEK